MVPDRNLISPVPSTRPPSGSPSRPALAGTDQLRLLFGARMAAGDYFEFAGGSMRPVLRPGDRVRVRPRAEPPAPGDIVVFSRGPSLVMHRVIEVDCANQLAVTRGDANFRADPPVAVREILGCLDGLYDQTTGAAGSLPLLRRFWNTAMRQLIRARRLGFPFDAALCTGPALLRTVCGLVRKQLWRVIR